MATKMTFPPEPEVLYAAYPHMLSKWPEEGCGVITPAGFVPCENISEGDKTKTFAIAPEVWVEHEVLAVVHSHTNGNLHASKVDMEQQIVSGVPWWIIICDQHNIQDAFWLGDSCPIPPLIGRKFRHGVTDCYALIRDAYRLGKEALADNADPDQRITGWPFDPVMLPQVPREHLWWSDPDDVNPDANLYESYFRSAGFEVVDSDEAPQVGDGFLARFHPGQRHNPKINHAGLYIGNGLILHHVEGALSMRSPLRIYQNTISNFVRYRGASA